MTAINWKNTHVTKVEFTKEGNETPFSISRTKSRGRPEIFGICAVEEFGERTGRLSVSSGEGWHRKYKPAPSAPMVVLGTKASTGVWYERIAIPKDAWRSLVEAEYKRMHPEGLDSNA